MAIHDKIRYLAEIIEKQTKERLIATGLGCEGNLANAATIIHEGNKYYRVDIGSSGRYMVEKSSSKIFGIKAYGVIHKGHQYGTLYTVDDWYWGNYVAQPKKKAS